MVFRQKMRVLARLSTNVMAKVGGVTIELIPISIIATIISNDVRGIAMRFVIRKYCGKLLKCHHAMGAVNA